MLRRAVDAHKPTTNKPTLSQQLFPSSSPQGGPLTATSSSTATAATTAKAFGSTSTVTSRAPLRANPPSTTNASGSSKPPHYSNTAVKRTSSGLTKTATAPENVAFDDNLSGWTQPSELQHTSTAPSTLFFDENDFDSDIDLDIEDPTSKPTVTYPSLPKAVPGQPASPITYPKVHKANFHSGAPVAYSPEATAYQTAPPPPSSIPLPWSSSPESHKHALSGQNIFGGFAYTRENIAKVQASRPEPNQQDNVSSEHAPRPTKRRTLPWLEAHAAKEVTENSNEPKLAENNFNTQATPSSKASTSATAYPWNTTASAIKEQQKQLRKQNNTKKVVKTNDALDEANLATVVKKRSTTVARPHLSEEQRHILDLVVDSSKSVFFTGSAGTGKSVLLREIISVLRKKYSREIDRIAITASTGLAACNIGGVTLHSFAGIGLGKEGVDELVKKIKRNQKAKHRWMRTKVLVIDEVSMVDGELFDKLEEVARRLRNNGKPFGGIQLVITGDFFQLPPVPDHGSSRGAQFCFEAGTWTAVIDHTIGLHHVFRQKDPVFAGMLNEMRSGHLSPASINAFKQLSRELPTSDGVMATELFPTRNEVDAANSRRMQQLTGQFMIFEARDGGTIVDKTARDKLLQNCMAPQMLQLKKGAQVMLIKNIDETLVNGSVGKVLGFMDEATWNNYNAEPEDANEEADGDVISNMEKFTTKKNKPKIDAMLGTTSQKWPAVRFMNTDGTTRDLLCQRESWKVELPNGEVQASRSQIPLILAWALSIHKAQGQTMERVKVDLGKVFEKGQAYVALSRATSMAGLQVLRFDPSKVLAHDRVRNFYNGLSRAEALEASEKTVDEAPSKAKLRQ